MITLLVLFSLLSSYAFYLTSQKAQLSNSNSVSVWLQKHTTLAKAIGIACLIIAAILAIASMGLTSGTLLGLMLFSIILSLVIVLTPLKIIGFKQLLGLFLFIIILEILL